MRPPLSSPLTRDGLRKVPCGAACPSRLDAAALAIRPDRLPERNLQYSDTIELFPSSAASIGARIAQGAGAFRMPIRAALRQASGPELPGQKRVSGPLMPPILPRGLHDGRHGHRKPPEHRGGAGRTQNATSPSRMSRAQGVLRSTASDRAQPIAETPERSKSIGWATAGIASNVSRAAWGRPRRVCRLIWYAGGSAAVGRASWISSWATSSNVQASARSRMSCRDNAGHRRSARPSRRRCRPPCRPTAPRFSSIS